MNPDATPETPEPGDEPSSNVLDELNEAFGGEPHPPGTARTRDLPGTARTRASATRMMSDTELEAVPEALPAPKFAAESTRRSRRRSQREAKREAKQEAKRLAKLAKEQQESDKKTAKASGKADRAAKKASRKSRRQSDIDVETDLSEGVVRIIDAPPAPPSPPSLAPPIMADAQPPSPARPTIAIADDELPDAVYLEGDLGSGGSGQVGSGVVKNAGGDMRSTVFIDDRGPGTGEIVAIDVATSAARMEPRMRERRIAVKRAVGRKRLKWTAAAVLVVGVTIGTLAVLGSGAFAITNVEVEGAVYSRGAQLDEVVDFLEGANVLRVDTDRAERMLEQIPWIADARVSADFPHGATIEIRERKPIVTYRGSDNRYRVLDVDGRVLDVLDGQPVDYLELIVEGGPDLDAGQLAPTGYRAAATLVSALTPHMRQLTTSVSASQDATELSLTLEGQIEVRFGAAEDLLAKLVRLQTVLTDPDPENDATALIDVSTEDLIIR